MTSPKHQLDARGIYPKKRMGQNFLCDPQAAEMIVRKAGLDDEDTVLEIGAGTGALTLPTARRVDRLYAVETDDRLIAVLQDTLRANNLKNVAIIHEDILETDIRALARDVGNQLTVVGNLPYNISSQIIIRLIHFRDIVPRAVLMLQKELARRLTATPGSKDYGRPTAMLRYCAETVTLASVKPDLFYPRPRVSSEVIEIKFKNKFSLKPWEETLLFDIIKAAFGKRRKTLRNALLNQDLGLAPDICEAALKNAGTGVRARAETLDARDYVDICKHYIMLKEKQEADGS
jgi:16S rRNA (adenine1518-N6/adenine1519-N6)-dimethyltransferase